MLQRSLTFTATSLKSPVGLDQVIATVIAVEYARFGAPFRRSALVLRSGVFGIFALGVLRCSISESLLSHTEFASVLCSESRGPLAIGDSFSPIGESIFCTLVQSQRPLAIADSYAPIGESLFFAHRCSLIGHWPLETHLLQSGSLCFCTSVQSRGPLAIGDSFASIGESLFSVVILRTEPI
ncbi:hypothetical protein QYF36_017649 [Acer negundo]|nr:hypothetical protein QYF36_017649 [Acer negundo]